MGWHVDMAMVDLRIASADGWVDMECGSVSLFCQDAVMQLGKYMITHARPPNSHLSKPG